jgi:uncharacterized protein YndB with AHSA1/START domain
MQAAQPTCFVIADISGYTGYLTGVELDHAQDILADLIGAVVSALRPTFRLAKLEGDAAFMYAPLARIDGSLLLDVLERCYFGFRRRRRDVRQATSCECNACARIPDLDLKFVVHHGLAIQHAVAGRKELAGADVIVVHRLLKNEVQARLGLGAYALFTQASLDVAGLDPVALAMLPYAEAYEHIGEITAWVHDLERRWREEEDRQRVFVRPADAILDITVDVGVPPQLAWEFLTTPGQRMSWQPWVTQVTIKGADGGRRGPGSANHCMHGKDAVVEEILDWRPYDYVTDRTVIDTPHGAVKFTHTIEFEPTTDGTTVHMRYAPPRARQQRELGEQIAASYGAAVRSALPALVEQLEARNPVPE